MLEKECTIPCVFDTKETAQLMLLRNLFMDEGIGAGSIGKCLGWVEDVDGMAPPIVLVEFTNSAGDKVVKEISPCNHDFEAGGEIVASRFQYPLVLSYAMTIHKSQGMTIDLVEIDFKGAWDYGQVYVALSRARDLSRLCVRNLQSTYVKAHPLALRFYSELGSA